MYLQKSTVLNKRKALQIMYENPAVLGPRKKKNLDFYSISGMQFNERSIARIMSQISVSLHEHVVGGSRVGLYRYRQCVVRLRSMCFCSERSL